MSDGTDALCLELYGMVEARHYVGGADAQMLYDGAARIKDQRAEIARLQAVVDAARAKCQEFLKDEAEADCTLMDDINSGVIVGKADAATAILRALDGAHSENVTQGGTLDEPMTPTEMYEDLQRAHWKNMEKAALNDKDAIFSEPCPTCKGNSEQYKWEWLEECPTCGGSGREG